MTDTNDAQHPEHTGHPEHPGHPEHIRHRRIRSFVRREGRLTPGQEKALTEQWGDYGLDYTSETIDLDTLFARSAPTTMEIGFGNGECLLSLATTNPDENFIGVEVHRPGVGRILRRMAEAGLSNIRVSQHDAVEVLSDQIPNASLDRVLLFFADPWHKKKHHKRRIVQAEFAQLVARKLKPNGIWHMATDWQHYAEWMVDVMQSQPQFINLAHQDSSLQTVGTNVHLDSEDRAHCEGRANNEDQAMINLAEHCVPRPATRPVTHFEKRGEKLGHGIWDLVYQKR